MTVFTACSVFGQPLARGARCSDRECPQHGLPPRELGRNYSVGSALVRWEALAERYALLFVESIQERPRQSQSGLMLRHEQGHREYHPCNTSIPIERALFGYQVLSEEESAQLSI